MGFSGTSPTPSPRRAAAYGASALDGLLSLVLPCPPGVSGLLSLVQQLVPGARLVRELPHELVLVLPYGGAVDGSFARLFWEVDQRLEELGLAGYGISDTSLEEVRVLEGGLPGGGAALEGGGEACSGLSARLREEEGHLQGTRGWEPPREAWGPIVS